MASDYTGMMKYCVIGNIVKKRIDEKGETKYGVAVFPGGRKVYISRNLENNEVVVMGLNRFKSRYSLEWVPLDCIENIRPSRTFKPRVIELSFDYEGEYQSLWFRYKAEDKIAVEEYARILNRLKAGDRTAMEQYYSDIELLYYEDN